MISEQPPKRPWVSSPAVPEIEPFEPFGPGGPFPIFKPEYAAEFNLQSHRQMQNAPLVGTGAGALGGAGLGALFSALSGMNPVPSLAVGAGLGGISGNVTGRQLRNMYNTSISDNEAAQLAQQLDAEAGTNAFTQAYLADPEGFKANIATKI